MVTHLARYSALLLVTPENNLLFHQRDNKPGIANPGQIGMYGGGVEEAETFEEAALRELEEELGIEVTPEKMHFFSDYRKTKEIHGVDQQGKVFIIRNLKLEDLRPNPHEGQGYVVISPEQDIVGMNLSIMARDLINLYRNKSSTSKA